MVQYKALKQSFLNRTKKLIGFAIPEISFKILIAKCSKVYCFRTIFFICFSLCLVISFVVPSKKVFAQQLTMSKVTSIDLLNKPANSKYKLNNRVTMQVTFDKGVCVPLTHLSGVYLSFYIGAVSGANLRKATLVAPSNFTTRPDNGFTSLQFEYTIADEDTGAVTVSPTSPLLLFGCDDCPAVGGTVTPISTGGYTTGTYNCENSNSGVDQTRSADVINVSATADGVVPRPDRFLAPSSVSPVVLKIGDTLDFTVRFDEVIRLGVGSPALYLKLGTKSSSPSVTANYKTGSISGQTDRDAVFTYTVAEGDSLSGTGNSIFSLYRPPLFIGNSIVDVFGNSAANDAPLLDVTGGSNYSVDGIRPRVNRIGFIGSPNGGTPTDGTYLKGDKIYVEVEFDDVVTVTGVPELAMDVGGSIKWALYDAAQSQISSHRSLTFSYTVVSADSDSNGISIPRDVLKLPSGSLLTDDTGNNVATVTCPPGYSGGTACVRVHSALTISNHGGHKVDGSKNSITPGDRVGDNAGPEPVSVYVDASGSPPGSYKIGDTIDFIVTFNEAIKPGVVGIPTLHLKLGTLSDSPSVTAHYKTGSISGQTDRDAVFTYTVAEGDVLLGTGNSVFSLFDPPLHIGNSIVDLFGNSAKNQNTDQPLSIADGAGYVVDGIRPQVSRIRFIGGPNGGTPADGTYLRGDKIYVAVEFEDAVTVTGVPELALEMGSGSVKWARYDATQNQRTSDRLLTFSYTVHSSDSDSDGISIPRDVLKLPENSSIKDSAGNTIATVSCPSGYSGATVCVKVAADLSISNDRGHKVNGSKKSLYPTGPSESEIFDVRVRTPAANKPGYGNIPYRTGSVAIIDVSFLNDVEVVSGSHVYIPVVMDGGEEGAKTVKFSYSPMFDRSNRDNRLTFAYIITRTDFDKDGFELKDPPGAEEPRVHGSVRYIGQQQLLTPVKLELRALSTSANDNLSVNYFPAPYGSLVSKVKVVTPSSYGNGTTPYQEGHVIVIEVTFSEAVYVPPGESDPYINLEIGPNGNPTLRKAFYSSDLDSENRDNKLTFSYTLKADDIDTDGFSIENGGKVYGVVKSVQTQGNLTDTQLSYPSLLYSSDDNLQINPDTRTVDPLMFVFENPAYDSTKSGIGIFSGWACPDVNTENGSDQSVTTVEISIDDSPIKIPIPYGSLRSDTAGQCDDHANNGFISVYNFNLLGPGEHSASLYVNGVETGRKQRFNVVTTGQEWLEGESGNGIVYLNNDYIVHLEWEQSKQGVKIIGFNEEVDPILPILEKPSTSPTHGLLEVPVDGSISNRHRDYSGLDL